MANTTNFGWETPDDTDLVKDGAAAMRTLGNSIDASFVDLKGGTTGQILSKNSNTDLDFVWIANDQGDITAVTAGTGISGGGTSGAVTITNSMATEITAAGDIIVGTGSGTFDNLPIGTTGQVLTADTTVSPYKVKWASASSTPVFVGSRAYPSSDQTISNNTGTIVNLGNETYDTDAFHSTSTNTSRMTIPSDKNGYYLVIGKIGYASNTTGARQVRLLKNGTIIEFNSVASAGSGASGNKTVYSSSAIINCAVGDYIEMAAYQDSGGNLNLDGSSDTTSLTIQFLGV